MSKDKPKILKRINLGLPPALYDELVDEAKREASNVTFTIVKFLRIGLHVYKEMRAGNRVCIIDKDDEKKQKDIMFI